MTLSTFHPCSISSAASFFLERPAMGRPIKWNEEKLISNNEYYAEIKKVSPKIAGLDANVIILNFSPGSSSNCLTWPFWQTIQKNHYLSMASSVASNSRFRWPAAQSGSGRMIVGGRGSSDPAFPLIFHDNPAFRTFVISDPECRFLYQWPFSH